MLLHGIVNTRKRVKYKLVTYGDWRSFTDFYFRFDSYTFVYFNGFDFDYNTLSERYGNKNMHDDSTPETRA
jgi:hypothetical protein